jgi:hypothetical protein
MKGDAEIKKEMKTKHPKGGFKEETAPAQDKKGVGKGKKKKGKKHEPTVKDYMRGM